MDFKRIQVVLVFFFVVFDAYLLMMLFNRSDVNLNPVTDVSVSIEENLANRGITFSSLATDKYQLPFVVAQSSNHLAEHISQLEGQEAAIDQQGVLASTFQAPVDLGLGITAETTGLTEDQRLKLEPILTNPSFFISGEYYRNVWYVNTEKAIYIRMLAADGNPIVDGTAEIRISLDDQFQMIGYTQTYQDQMNELSTKRTILSERETLEIIDRRVETLIPDDSTIRYSVLVYYQSTALSDLNVYSPAWQIIYDNTSGRIALLVDAIKGTVIERKQIY